MFKKFKKLVKNAVNAESLDPSRFNDSLALEIEWLRQKPAVQTSELISS